MIRNGKAYIYIGLDSQGNVVELVKDGQTIPWSQAADGHAHDTESVGTFELIRKKATTPTAPGTDPCCVRLPSGQIKCFC